MCQSWGSRGFSHGFLALHFFIVFIIVLCLVLSPWIYCFYSFFCLRVRVLRGRVFSLFFIFYFSTEVFMSFKRRKLRSSSSKKLFSRTASLSHRKNFRTNPMRGGIRL